MDTTTAPVVTVIEKDNKEPWWVPGPLMQKIILWGIGIGIVYYIIQYLSSACQSSDSTFCKVTTAIGKVIDAAAGVIGWVADNIQILIFLALGAIGIYAGWILISKAAKNWGSVREAESNPETGYVLTRDGDIAIRDPTTREILVDPETGEVLRPTDVVIERMRIIVVERLYPDLLPAVSRLQGSSLSSQTYSGLEGDAVADAGIHEATGEQLSIGVVE